jgi:hypothetical protein
MAILADEDIAKTLAARDRFPDNKAAAARSLGLSESTYKTRLAAFARLGVDGATPGVTPIGMAVRETNTLYNRGEESLMWVKRSTTERDPLDVAQAIKEAMADVKPWPKIAAPKAVNEDLLTLYPLADLHLGMYAWGAENGGDNWDLKIAEDVIGRCVDETADASPDAATALIVFGGDYFHADNKSNQTARSGNVLDVDGRYDKVIDAGSRLAVRIVDRAAQKHRRVIVRVLKGNHDEHSSVALAYYLKGHYRLDKRITIIVEPSLFYYHTFGDVLLGFTHGHECKITDFPQVMAVHRAEDWGKAKFRYCHGFHLHHKKRLGDENGGCEQEVHRTVIPQDGWHFGRGFLSGRAMQSITYHKSSGEYRRTTIRVLDNVILPANDNVRSQSASMRAQLLRAA